MDTKEKTFIPLTDDLLFKETFGLPKNIRFLEYFLEVYFNYPFGYLKDKLEVFYESPIEKSRYYDKGFRNDLKVIINNEIICNIEIYSTFNKESLQKSKSYIMRIYSTQLDIGDEYSNIKKVTQINFVDNISNEVKVLIDEEIKKTLYLGDERTSEDLNLDIVRLDLARNIDYNDNNRFMRLLNFIGAQSKEERDEVAKGDEMLMEINKWVNNYVNDDDMWWRVHNDEYWNKRIYREAGREEGLIDGRNERNIEIAKNLLKTNLTLEEIENLQKEN